MAGRMARSRRAPNRAPGRMFRASPDSSQIDLFSNLEQFLRERDQEQLNDPNAWHNVILDQVVKRVSEERFVELFDEATGRPNAPLRVLVGMLILKEGFGWSDEELDVYKRQLRGRPRFSNSRKWRTMFSTSTIGSSTRMPMEKIRANRVTRLRVKPRR